MDDDQQFCLRWNNHQSTLISVFDTLLENGTLVDCTLAAEGQFLKAHKVVLSACSPYFANLLKEQYDKHPIFILKDVKYQELRAMMDYMYRGEVNISQDQLAALLKAAESLQIKGLSDNRTSASAPPKSEHPKVMSHQTKPGGGYTLEQKRPRLGPSTIDTQELLSREGSNSPTPRKRKKMRPRSVENVVDNHEHSNSSAHSIQQQQQISSAPLNTSQQQSSQQQPQQQIVTKKTDTIKTTGGGDVAIQQQIDNDTDQQQQNDKQQEQALKLQQNETQKLQKQRKEKDESILLEPKNEYEDDGHTIVEDLTREDQEDDELIEEEMDQAGAGPSHQGGEGSSQGFSTNWPADRSQDEFIMQPDQGQQRDPQGQYFAMNLIRPTPLHQLIGTNSLIGINNNLNDRNLNNNTAPMLSQPPPPPQLQSQQLAINNVNTLDEEESYSCPQCYRIYRRSGTLRRHLRHECGKGKSMVCSVCGHRTKRADHLLQHVRKRHPEIANRYSSRNAHSLNKPSTSNSNNINIKTEN